MTRYIYGQRFAGVVTYVTYTGTSVHIRGGNEMLHIQAQVFIRGVW